MIALIVGINGQDGSYLAELLLSKNYEVHGVVRRSSVNNLFRINNILSQISLHYGDLSDSSSLVKIIQSVKPNEIYNLAAQSDVKVSFDNPEYTANIDAIGTLRLLEACRICGIEKTVKFYQASTSELFGKVEAFPQSETTPFHPYSPYAISKLYSYWIVREYREAYGMYAVNGILFNHESERRGEEFVTRKITLSAARIVAGQQNYIELGNLDSLRDWGYAKDYVQAMWSMLQQEHPQDFVIATGEQHSVREFVEETFRQYQIDILWQGYGVDEIGTDKKTGKILVKVSPNYFRPTEVDNLCGDASKAKAILNWKPSVTFKELVHIMVHYDRERVLNGKNI